MHFLGAPSQPNRIIALRRLAWTQSTVSRLALAATVSLGGVIFAQAQENKTRTWATGDGVWDTATQNWVRKNGDARRFQDLNKVVFDTAGVSVTVSNGTTVVPSRIDVSARKISISGGTISSGDADRTLRINLENNVDIDSALSGSFSVKNNAAGANRRLTLGAANPDLAALSIGANTTVAANAGLTADVRSLGKFTSDGDVGALLNRQNATTTVAGSVEGDLINRAGGEAEITGDVDGNLTNRAGAEVTVGQDVTGTVVNRDGTVTLGGSVGGTVANSAPGTGSATLTLTGEGARTGSIETTQGAVTIIRGSVDTRGNASFVAGGGSLIVTSGASLDTDLTVRRNGTFTLRSNNSGTGTLTGNLTTLGTSNLRGTIVGDLTAERGTVNIVGDVTVEGAVAGEGTIAVTGGDLDVTEGVTTGGTVTVATDRTLTTQDGTRVEAGGTLTVEDGARVRGDVTVAPGGRLDLDGALGTRAENSTLTVEGDAAFRRRTRLAGTVNGDVTGEAASRIVVDGDTRVRGDVTTSGLLRTEADLTVDGALSAGPGADVDIESAVTAGTLELGGTDAAPAQVDIAAGASVTLNGRGATVDADGDLTVSGTLTGEVAIRDGGDAIVAQGGALDGDVTVRQGGTATLRATGTLTGDVTVREGGDFTMRRSNGDVALLDGNLEVAGTAKLRGDVTGDLTIEGDAATGKVLADTTVNGTVRSDGKLTVDAGATLETGQGLIARNGATTNLRGDVLGPLTARTGSTTTVSGTLLGAETTHRLAGETALSGTIQGQANNTAAASLSIDGSARIDGGLRNGGELRVRSGASLALGSDVENRRDTARMVFNGNGTVAGAFSNLGTVRVNGNGSLGVTGDMRNEVDGRVIVNGDADFGQAFTNAGEVIVEAVGRLDGAMVNTGDAQIRGAMTGDLTNVTGGTAFVGRSASITGNVDNFGTLTLGGGSVNGVVTLGVSNDGAGNRVSSEVLVRGRGATAAGLIAGGGALSLLETDDPDGEGVTEDRLRVTGAVDLGEAGTVTRVDLDVDLTSGDDASADRLTFDQAPQGAGKIALHFNLTEGASGPLPEGGVPILRFNEPVTDSRSLLASVADDGRPQTGTLIYPIREVEGGGGDLALFSELNPAIGGLTGGITLVQSLIGSVVNRPSSSFVSGLGADPVPPCGLGSWARVQSGSATVEGSVNTTSRNGDDQEFLNTLEASYSGFQVGGDYACFRNQEGGWDLAFGATLGGNQGSIEQPVFGFDFDSNEQDLDRQVSTLKTDFSQDYYGLYMVASRGNLSADVQLRRDTTTFSVKNSGVSDAEKLGVDGREFDSNSNTFGASVRYRFILGEEARTVLSPQIGFSFTSTETDKIDLGEDGALQIEDHTSRVGFLSLTAQRGFSFSGGALGSVFATGTVYRDFADAVESTFTDADGSEQTLFADNLGTYGEFGLGGSYLKVFDKGQAGPARQLTAVVRADSRFSERVDGWGITANVRLQF